ncbi:MAG: M60 family peptidase N-terminal accessory domain-containing protein [Verrucomicrobiota bacterium]
MNSSTLSVQLSRSNRLKKPFPFAMCSVLLALGLGMTSASAQSITNAIAALKNHITGAAPLTGAQIKTQDNSIKANIRQVGTNDVALAAAFDLVNTYDTTIGALFTTADTKNGFTRNGAGYELEQALFDLQQGMLDYSYTPANLVTYFDLLNNAKFATSTYFPGAVTPPASTNTGYSVQINASHPEAWGSPVLYEDFAARRPTGCYLAPGSIAFVTVPPALVNKGYSVRVGPHYWDLSAKTTLKRLDRVSLVYPITSASTRVANPLGGNIYIEVPYKITNGIVNVGITNVVRSPFFSATSFHQTTLNEWLTVERTQPGKWADFESDKFMMQVPRSWIYNYTNAVNVMQDWDAAMDAVSDLMGLPQIRPKTVMYAQIDVLYRTTVNAPGYPMVNDPYNPNTSENGNKNHYLLTGPQNSAWTTLHELGHSQLFTKFSGESESAVNLLYVAAMNRKFGVPLNTAFGDSIGGHSGLSLNQAALSWILVNKFRAGQNMADTDMKYQHRGHGKYVEIANLFGWDALSNFWHSVNVDYENGITYLINSDPADSRILRMSKAAGADLRPLIHMWGVKPVNANNLKNSIQNAGLKPSTLIYNRLKDYQGIVPLTLQQFRNHYWTVKGTLNDTDNAWYEDMFNNYTADIGYASIAALQDIIDLYFPDGPPSDKRWTGADSAVWDTSTVNWQSLANGTATNYVNGNPGDAVMFDDALAGNSTVTLNTTVTPGSVLFSNYTTAYSIVGSGQIAGVGPLTKTGSGTVTLSGAHTFNGGIDVHAGEFIGVTGGACANNIMVVRAGATNGVQVQAANGQWSCKGLNSYSGSYIDFRFGSVSPSTTTAPLQVNGSVTLTGARIIVQSAGALGFGQYPLIKYTGVMSGAVPLKPFALPALPPGASGLLVNNTANQSIDLVVTVVTALKWAAGNGNWDINTTANWSSNGVAGFTYSDGKEVVLDDTASGASPIFITNSVAVSPAKVTANLTNKSYTVSGSPITGSAAVI